MSTISITSDETRIISASISWELHGEFRRIPAPQLSEEERQILRILFNELCMQIRAAEFNSTPLEIDVNGAFFCEDGHMRLPASHYRLMTDAVALFLGELGHSPTEIEVVTGVAAVRTSELLSKMQAATMLAAAG